MLVFLMKACIHKDEYSTENILLGEITTLTY